MVAAGTGSLFPSAVAVGLRLVGAGIAVDGRVAVGTDVDCDAGGIIGDCCASCEQAAHNKAANMNNLLLPGEFTIFSGI